MAKRTNLPQKPSWDQAVNNRALINRGGLAHTSVELADTVGTAAVVRIEKRAEQGQVR
jgi:3-dehydroquinate dehydratase